MIDTIKKREKILSPFIWVNNVNSIGLFFAIDN